MAEKLKSLKRTSPVAKPNADGEPQLKNGDNDTLWSEIESLDRLTDGKTLASGHERDALKTICEKHGLNAAALRLFRRVNKQDAGKQADFLRTWDLLSGRLSCKDQQEMPFEEGR